MMRRAPFVLVGTVVGLSSVLTFRSTPATIHLSLSGGAGSVGVVSTGGATTSTTVHSTATSSTSTVPTSTPAPTTTSAPMSNTVSSSNGVAVSHARCATTTSPSVPATTTPAPTTSTIHSIPVSPNGTGGPSGVGGDDNEGNDGTDMSASGPIHVKLAASSVPSTRTAHAVTTTTICTAANGATPNVAKHKHPTTTTTVHHTPTTTVHHTPTTTTTKPPVTTTSVPPTTTTTVSATRTAVGATYNYNFGTMSVSVTVNGKTIKSVKVASLNDFGSGQSAYIDGQAIPLLINEAMAAQSAKIASISGASYTSAGFQASLQSALTKLGL